MENNNLVGIVGGNGTLTSPFGSRNTSVTNASNDHKGVDLVSNIPNAPVYARYDGIVAKIGVGNGYGNYVLLKYEQSDGTIFYALYAHLSVQLSTDMLGRPISAGDYVGNIGHSVGGANLTVRDHLHYEERIATDGSNGDPYQVFLHAVPIDPVGGYIGDYQQFLEQNTNLEPLSDASDLNGTANNLANWENYGAGSLPPLADNSNGQDGATAALTEQRALIWTNAIHERYGDDVALVSLSDGTKFLVKASTGEQLAIVNNINNSVGLIDINNGDSFTLNANSSTVVTDNMLSDNGMTQVIQNIDFQGLSQELQSTERMLTETTTLKSTAITERSSPVRRQSTSETT